MPNISVKVSDPATRITLGTLLQADGHRISDENPDIVITDDISGAPSFAQNVPTLVLAGVSQIRDAVAAMAKGVFGYVFVPVQPGEAEIMVRRALGSRNADANQEIRSLESVETEHLLRVLRQCKNSRAKAARMLGVGRNTLWRKLKRIESAREKS